MRGYGRLKRSGRLDLVVRIKDDLTNAPLGIVESGVSQFIMGAAAGEAERAVRQYLLLRVVSTLSLPRSLLLALGRPGAAVVHPLPAAWQRVLEQHGFRVARVWSSLAFAGLVAASMLHAVFVIVRTAWQGLAAAARGQGGSPGRHVYFHAITAGNLPQAARARSESYDVVSWYVRWQGRVPELEAIHHGVRDAKAAVVDGISVTAVDAAVPPLSRLTDVLRFLGWGAAASVYSLVDLLRGRWWHGLLLSEAAKAAAVRAQSADRLAREYLFHNGNWLYRPLWTYDAERRGSRVTLLFYSTNCEDFKEPAGYPVQANSWQVLTWPRYLVWDSGQEAFVHRAVGDRCEVRIVGPIWFQDSARDLPALPTRAVAVFDVQPHRTSRYRLYALALEYYTPGTSTQFLLDIHAAAAACGATMVLKRKRNIGKLVHPRYESAVERLATLPDVVAIEPEVSALRVITACQVAISMPFSSTALQARDAGKPSIYYDPFGVVQKDDRGAHGISVVTGPAELARWMQEHVSESTT